MPREFSFNKSRMNLLAGLVEDDDLQDTKHTLTEEYKKELDEDVKEVCDTLKEYTAYTGFKPENSEGEDQNPNEEPDENRPGESVGLPGWTYYDADPTFSKLSTLKDDLGHKMSEDELKEAFRVTVNDMIQEHALLHEILPLKEPVDLPGELGIDPDITQDEIDASYDDIYVDDYYDPDDDITDEDLDYDEEEEYWEDDEWNEPWQQSMHRRKKY